MAESTLRFVGQSLTSASLVLMPGLISVISLSTGCASWFHSQPMLLLILGSIWIDLDVWFPSRFLHGDISQIELDIYNFFMDLSDLVIHGLCLISVISSSTGCVWSLHSRTHLLSAICVTGFCLCDCLRTHLLSVIYLCNYLQAPNISVVFAYSDLCDIGFTAVSVIWFGWPLRFCYLVVFGGHHDSHRDSSRALLDLCDLYFFLWPLYLNLSLQLISVWECFDLSLQFYLCVLGFFPWVWTVYLSLWLSESFDCAKSECLLC